MLERAGLAGEFTYHGAVDRDGKLAFLQSIDVLSVPATYDEPKGILSARGHGERRAGGPAAARRVHRDRRTTGGGLLVEPDAPDASPKGLHAIWAIRRWRRRRRGRTGL